MTNVSQFSAYGLTNLMESDINRSWQLGANKNFYMSSVDQHLCSPSDPQHEVLGHSDHWSSYGYPLPTYSNISYHGYGHQYDGMDMVPKTSFIVPSQQVYSSTWHVPYGDSSHSHNASVHGGHYGQKYYQSAFVEAPYSSVELGKSGSDGTSSSEYFSQFPSPSTSVSSNPQSNATGRSASLNVTKLQSVIQKNPAYESGRDTYLEADNRNNMQSHSQQMTERSIIRHTKNAISPQSCQHFNDVQVYKQSTEKCARSVNMGNSLPLSNHVKKQERKMTKILHDMLKTNSSKASQLLDFYRYHFTLIEQHFCTEIKTGIYPGRTTQGEADFQVLQLIQQVHQQLGMMGYQKANMGPLSRKNALTAEVRKTRLLPKRSVKILETWFEDNLSNPYPSRDQTLHLAMDCELTVEQIRKWFANKRNRSRNNKVYK